jgi:TonB family protein
MGQVQQILETFLTRADGTPIPVRRRSQPMSAQNVDLARNSETIPRPQGMLNTPYPTVDTIQPPMADLQKAVKNARGGNKNKMVYIVAGASVLVGALGLAYGLRSGSAPAVPPPAPAPAPMAAMPAPPIPVAKEPQKIAVELESDIANARVTFRRRVASAPMKSDVSPTDVVELVEFSAPGYKTERYWVTFDRATHLKAHLIKGNGLDEASEEATLVALGEAEAPAPKAVAVAAAAPAPTPSPAAAPTPAQAPTATVAIAEKSEARIAPRRKIGRSAPSADAPETSVTTEAIARVPTRSAEPAAAMVAIAPAPPQARVETPAPAPAPVAAPVAAPTPAPAPAAITAVQPKPTNEMPRPAVAAPMPAAPAQNIAPSLFTSLRASGSAIEPPETVQTQMMHEEKTKTSAVIKVCIDGSGSVTSSSTAKSSGYQEYDRRLMDGVKSWRYRPYMVNGKATPACSAVVFAFKLQ